MADPLNRSRGQTLVEFALVLPALLMFIGLTVNVLLWGLALNSALTAAGDAARSAIVQPADCNPDDEQAQQRLTLGLCRQKAAWNILRDRVNIALNPGLGQGWSALIRDDSLWRDNAWAWVEYQDPLTRIDDDYLLVETNLHLSVFFFPAAQFTVPIRGRAVVADFASE